MYAIAQILNLGTRQTIGFLAYDEEADRVTKPVVYPTYQEAEKRVYDLNAATRIKECWPDANDPDVVALLTDPSFCPIVEVTEVSLDDEGIPENSLPKESSPFWRISQACETVARKRAGV